MNGSFRKSPAILLVFLITYVPAFCQELNYGLANLLTDGSTVVEFLGARNGFSHYLSHQKNAMGKATAPFEFMTVNESDGKIAKTDLQITEKKVTPQHVLLTSENRYTLLLSIASKGTISVVARTFDSELAFVSDKVLTTMKSMAYIKEYSNYLNKLSDLEPVVSDNGKYLAFGFRHQTVVYDSETEEVVVNEHPEAVNISFHMLNNGQCFAFRMYDSEFRLDLLDGRSGVTKSLPIPSKAGDMMVSVQSDEAQNLYAVILKGKEGLWGDYVTYRSGANINVGKFKESKTRASGYSLHRLDKNMSWKLLVDAEFETSVVGQLTDASDGIEWLTVEHVTSADEQAFVIFQQKHLFEKESISHRMGGIVAVEVDLAAQKEVRQIAIPRQCWTSEARKKYDHTYFRWHKDRPLLAYYESEKFKDYRFTMHFLDQPGVTGRQSVVLEDPHHNIYPDNWRHIKNGSILTHSPNQNSSAIILGTLMLP